MTTTQRVAPFVLTVFAQLGLFCAATAWGQGYAILPQRVTVEARSGASFTMPLKALSFSDIPIVIDIEHKPNAWTFEDSRGPSPINARVESVLKAREGDQTPWFEFPAQVNIEPNTEDQVIPISIQLPDDVSGTYEGEFIIQESGLDQLLTVGYRTTYQVIISNRPSYPLIDVERSAFNWREKQFSLDIGIKNTGNAALVLGGNFQIFSGDSARRRAVLSDSLEPASLSPGRTETIEQSLPASLPSGTYEVLVAPEVDGQRQRPMTSTATLLNAYEYGGNVNEYGLTSVPNLVRASIAPGARRNFPLAVQNFGESMRSLRLESINWLSEVPEHLALSLTPDTVDLQPGQERSLRLLIVTSPDYQPSPNPHYASIRLTGAEGSEVLVLLEISDTGFNKAREVSYSNARIVSDPDNEDRTILRYDIANTGTMAETPHFFLTLEGPGAIGTVIDSRLMALERFIGPGQSITETISLPLPLSVFQTAVRENRSTNLLTVFEAIEGGVKQDSNRILTKVEGLGLE